MTAYQKEQLAALQMVLEHLQTISPSDRHTLIDLIGEYRAYRKEVNAFLTKHLARVCTQKCYQSRLSACCSKEGIITFFADVVINGLVSSSAQIQSLLQVLTARHIGHKCIYLGPDGCRWQLKPIVCEMFICETAQEQVLDPVPVVKEEWVTLRNLKKRFTWPDQPVLFDTIERLFIEAGFSSPLMYMHNSPGLLRVKQRAK
ncbi:MAG: hypothetical protein R3274_00500 [Desulfobacterales bacterium]|nr:hypothetical protein [Desulfobacterales bacterium]